MFVLSVHIERDASLIKLFNIKYETSQEKSVIRLKQRNLYERHIFNHELYLLYTLLCVELLLGKSK